MSANIPKNGRPRQLDRAGDAEEQITPEQAQDFERLSRLLTGILKDIASLKRRFWPQRIDFEDIDIDNTGTTLYRFPHGLGGPVRWWPVDWAGAAAGPQLVRDASTDANTLVLVSYEAGTLTLRVEEAGA
jgi:hypothetical protein